MIPAHPEFVEKSYEHLIFNALKKLPDDCFVLHSLSILDPDAEGSKKETEIDFVVIIPDVGCVVIEAKSGRVNFTTTSTYFEGEKIEPYTWVYESGRPMKGNGPFRQSRDNMYALIAYLKNSPYSSLALKQKFYSCIWLHQISKKLLSNFPNRPECPKEQILAKEDLTDPFESLKRIIEFENPLMSSKNREPWNYQNAALIVSHVLAPMMNLVPGKNWEYEYKNEELNKLLIEQERILEFLSEQKIAVISGAAGTGKTMIAIKKAEIEANKGNKVLFLCYNSALSAFLTKYYKKDNIDYYNISQWACHFCKSVKPDYGVLSGVIEKQIMSNSFPYQVIIVDEAQDFGQDVIDNSEVNVLSKLHEAMILCDGLFFLFYDKNQVINSNQLPNFIKNADCKLTLYRNCRNTKKIAKASLKVLNKDVSPGPNVLEGDIPNIIFTTYSDGFKDLSLWVTKLGKKYSNVVILTVKTQNTTSFYERINNQTIFINGKKYPFYTCRQYKGLEADAVVLVDIDKNAFSKEKNKLIYYVGTSRAKFELVLLAYMNESECEESCRLLLGNSFIEGVDYKEQLSMALALKNSQ